MPFTGPCLCPLLAHVCALHGPCLCPSLSHVCALHWPVSVPFTGPCLCTSLFCVCPCRSLFCVWTRPSLGRVCALRGPCLCTSLSRVRDNSIRHAGYKTSVCLVGSFSRTHCSSPPDKLPASRQGHGVQSSGMYATRFTLVSVQQPADRGTRAET